MQPPEKIREWVVRKAKPEDIPFIYDTFLKSIKHCTSLGKSCRSRIFFDNYKRVVDKLLAESTTLVASLFENQNVILGYMVHTPTTIHFTFVKESFRDFRIGTSLFRDAFPLHQHDPIDITCTHKTFQSESIYQDHPFLQFNPFPLYLKEI